MSELFRKMMFDDIDIPSMPDLAIKVIAALEDEYCSIEKLEEIITKDLSITATILRIANAPLYKTGKTVNSIADAMVMIGLQNVVPFVCISALANQYSHAGSDAIVNRHLLAVSQAASRLAGHVTTVPIKREIAAIAGLFHDVGKIVLYSNIPGEYKKIQSKAQKEKAPFFVLEDEMLGFNHCIVGRALTTKWNLPVIYRETIKKHHDEKVKKSGLKEEDAVCYLIRISDKMVLDFENAPFISGESHLPELLAVLGVGEASYKQVAKQIREKGTVDI